jgi:hypothetical protein
LSSSLYYATPIISPYFFSVLSFNTDKITKQMVLEIFMKNYNSDFSSSPKHYSPYYRLNSVPEALFLIEAECFDVSADTTTHTKSSQKGVIFGWSAIAILLIIGGFQQTHLKDVTPANPQISKSEVGIVIDR